MTLSGPYVDTVNEMAATVIEAMVESDNIPHQLFFKAADMVNRWKDSTVELIYLMESATCLELDCLLDKYESHLCQCLYYANNYEEEI
jgi:hypothetical protein